MKSKIFLLAILVLGVILYMLSSKIEDSKCVNDAVRSANKGLVVISVLFVAMPIAALGFHMRCEKVKEYKGKLDEMNMYAIFFLLMGAVLVSLGATIHTNAKACNDVVGSSSAKSGATSVIVIGVLSILMSGGYLGYSYTSKKPTVAESSFIFPSY